MEQNVSFSTQVTEQDLYKFNIHHAYTSRQGIFSILVAVLILATWIMRFETLSQVYMILYPVVAMLFLFYIPFNLKLRAKQQSLQDVFSHPLNYNLSDSGIKITSPVADEPVDLPWEYIYKIVTWKQYLLVYTNRVNAYIIPKADIESSYDSVVTIIKNNVEDYKLTLK